jgi:hypothetical protein
VDVRGRVVPKLVENEIVAVPLERLDLTQRRVASAVLELQRRG